MPKRKKELLRNDFPALTQLLEEIARYREQERVQPSLPFETSVADANNNSRAGRPGEKKVRRRQENSASVLSGSKRRELF